MAKQNLLLVDADPRSLRVLEVSLRKAGYSVASCEDAHSALEMVDLSEPDLILSDTRLPELDGFAFVEKLRERPEYTEIPLIFLSSDGSVESKVRGLELGVEDYLTKPIYIKEIITRVNLVLQRHERRGLERRSLTKTRFSGSLSEMGLVDLLQTIDISRKSGVLELTNGGQRGTVYFKNGRLVHAESGNLQGDRAIYRFLVWNDGEFDLEFRTVELEKETIQTSTQGLLMEGMRRVDEWGRMLEQLPPLESIFEVESDELLDRLAEIPDEINHLLRLFDGQNSLMNVVDDAEEDDLQTLASISKLYFEGLIVDTGRTASADRDSLDEEAVVPAPVLPDRADSDGGLTSGSAIVSESATDDPEIPGDSSGESPSQVPGTESAETLQHGGPTDSSEATPEIDAASDDDEEEDDEAEESADTSTGEKTMAKKGRSRRRRAKRKAEDTKSNVIQFPAQKTASGEVVSPEPIEPVEAKRSDEKSGPQPLDGAEDAKVEAPEEEEAEAKAEKKAEEPEAEEAKAEDDAEEAKAEDDAEEAKAEDDAEEAKAEDDAEEAKAEDDAEEAKAEDDAEEAKAEDDAEEAKAEDDAEEAKAEDDAEEAKAEDDAEEAKAEDDGEPSEEVAQGVPVADDDEKKTEAKVEKTEAKDEKTEAKDEKKSDSGGSRGKGSRKSRKKKKKKRSSKSGGSKSSSTESSKPTGKPSTGKPSTGKARKTTPATGKGKETTSSQTIRAITSTGEHAAVASDFFTAPSYEETIEPDNWDDLDVVPTKLSGSDKKLAMITGGTVLAFLLIFGGYYVYQNYIMPTPVEMNPRATARLPEITPMAEGDESYEDESYEDETEDELAAGESEGELAEGETEGELAEGETEGELAEGETEGELAEGGTEGELAEGETEGELAEGETEGEAAVPAGDYATLLEEANGLRGRRKEAKLREAIAANPLGGEALTELAWLLLNRGQYAEARDFSQRASTIDPTSSKAWITLGAARQSLRDQEGAMQAYRNCVETGTGQFVAECRRVLR